MWERVKTGRVTLIMLLFTS